jgi:hypothetical protein
MTTNTEEMRDDDGGHNNQGWDLQNRVNPTQAVGDSMMLPKRMNTMRIYMQNTNGVSCGKMGDIDMLIDHLKHMEIDAFVLPETNLDTHKTRVRSQVHNHFRESLGQGTYQLEMATSNAEYVGHYKPGGVMGGIMGHNRGRILETGHDKYGRWIYFRLSGKGTRVITMIGTYQVCQGNVRTAGPTTALTQQYSMLVQDGYNEPHKVRQHHAKDLVQFVKERQQQGELVVVMGDFNEVIGDNNQGLTKLCSDCYLVDVIFEKHGYGARDFNSYARGTTCIDYVLMDDRLAGAVQECGYLPFNQLILSDHRGMFVDVDTIWFFGSETIPLQRMSLRDYTTKSIHHTAQFITKQYEHLEDHGWLEKIPKIQQCIRTGRPNHELVEGVDKKRIEACQYAGRKLKRYGPIPYSPELMQMKMVDKVINMIIRRLKHQEEYADSLEDLQQKLRVAGVEIPQDLEGYQSLRRTNKQALTKAIKEELRTGNLRQKFQDEAIKDALARGNKEKARRIQQVQRAEAISHVWKKCAHARGLTTTGGISHVYIPEDPTEDPKTCNNWKRVEDPPEVIRAINERLLKHFGQAKDCTWTTPPLDVTMDFEACCSKAEAILTGTYETDGLDPAATWIINNMKYIAGSQEAISHEITEEEFLGKLRVWDERTTTSPITNVHLGHGKAYYADHNLIEGSKEEQEFQQQRQKILERHLSVMNYCIQFGYSLNRWQKIVNALLEKDPGSPKIHRLRVIHLYEWDYNLLLGVKWRQLLHKVVDTGALNPACYGTTPGKSSLDPVFIKEMEYEIVRLTRQPLIHFDNDATSCYDRIPCFLANLASRKYGQAAKVCMVQGKTLQAAQYYLKTKFGISEESVRHTREAPWFGTGQGSGNSPMYWLLISSTLYDIYATQVTRGAKYETPDKQLTVTLTQLGFVDDVNNRTNIPWNNEVKDMQQLLRIASQESQLWYDIMEAANQSLELTKCCYHVMEYQFKPSGKPIMVTTTSPDNQLIVQDKNQNRVIIRHIPNDEATKYLGCWKAPQGQKQQKEALKKKCDDFARIINCSTLTRKETKYFYEGIYKPSVGYSLPTTYFTEKELEKIQSKAHQAMITHSGYNRYTATAVIYGMERLGGASFNHLYDMQGYGQVDMFMKSWRINQSHQGKLLRIALHWAQYCAGIGQAILEDTTTKLPYLESEWITSLRTYLGLIQGSIQVDQSGVIELMREHDKYIMEIAIQQGKYKPHQLRRINYCRMYLNITTISEITNAKGDMIDPAMMNGNKESTISKAKWQGVNQQKPDRVSWNLWRQVCKSISHKRNNKWYLHQRLGKWTIPHQKMRRQWPFWYDIQTDTLYQETSEGIKKHERMWYYFDTESTSEATLPPKSIPVDVDKLHNVLRLQPNQNNNQTTDSPGSSPIADEPTIQQAINQTPPWEQELIGGITLQVQEEALKQASRRALKIACDGSVQGKKASFAWVVATAEGTRLATCSGPAYGCRPTSYRAEGYGILSIMRFLNLLTNRYGDIGPSQIVCDNEAMVREFNTTFDPKKTQPNHTTIAEWDILIEIWMTKEHLSNQNITMNHIKGHSDNQQSYNRLTLLQQLNVDADKLANEYIQDHPNKDYTKAKILPSSGIQFHLPTGTITNQLKRQMKEARRQETHIQYLCKKNGWDKATFDSIAWEQHRRAINRHTKKRVTMVKYLNGISPVGKVVSRYDRKYSAKCPSCEESMETQDHVHQCLNPKREQWREQFKEAINQVMEKYDSPAPMRKLWLDGLEKAISDDDDTLVECESNLQLIKDTQQQIGWKQLLKGRMSKEWIRYQKEAMGASATKRKNAATWATDMVSTIFEQWLKLWRMRNEERHGGDTTERKEAERKQAIRELEQMYEDHGDTQEEEAWMLQTELNEQRAKSTYTIRATISNYRPVLEGSHQTQLETG